MKVVPCSTSPKTKTYFPWRNLGGPGGWRAVVPPNGQGPPGILNPTRAPAGPVVVPRLHPPHGVGGHQLAEADALGGGRLGSGAGAERAANHLGLRAIFLVFLVQKTLCVWWGGEEGGSDRWRGGGTLHWGYQQLHVAEATSGMSTQLSVPA